MKRKEIPHIVIDGMDKTGKSTLVRYLSEKLNLPVKKFSAPEGDPFLEYVHFLSSTQQPHIIDRFYLSELAYGPVMRGKSQINENQKAFLEGALLGMNALCIYAWDHVPLIKARFIADGETFIKPDDIEAVMDIMKKEVEESRLRWVPYQIGDSMNIIKVMYDFYHGEDREKLS